MGCVFFLLGGKPKEIWVKKPKIHKNLSQILFGLMKVIHIYIHIDLSYGLLCLGMDCRTIRHGKLYDFGTL